ncbi:hypothetical protein [Thalassobaculum litoreum]|uniref:Uncharacterized protein n=1 Tax=Thalassobaculum litoreum DSM 18839 TaxID=1123362 RepID=A0A8G2BI25_9PROT|nr:hypothetical protein [Thalassobaculum litoreum]SDF83872.1 hypothetical protein SAMN05660686_02486 [Thalassobaculum litoreum DSM 18839]
MERVEFDTSISVDDVIIEVHGSPDFRWSPFMKKQFREGNRLTAALFKSGDTGEPLRPGDILIPKFGDDLSGAITPQMVQAALLGPLDTIFDVRITYPPGKLSVTDAENMSWQISKLTIRLRIQMRRK